MKFLKNMTGNLMTGLYAGGGGVAARLVVNNMDKVPYIGTMKALHNPIAFLIGAALADVKSLHYAGVGAMAVSFTDAVAGYVPMVKSIGGVEDEETLNALAEEIAEELEGGVYDDVSNTEDAMNDDVSNAESAMNGI